MNSNQVPKCICGPCRKFVEKCFEFKQMCKKAEQLLVSYPLTGSWSEELAIPRWLHEQGDNKNRAKADKWMDLAASALRCWRCSSDASTAAFCDDPFSQDIITEQQRRWSFVDCSYPPGTGSYPFNQQLAQTRAVCKKMKQIINDRVVISRSCAWEDINAQPNSCINAQTPSYIKTEFCETCTTDGCNGASQYGPTILMVLLTALVAKLLAW